MKILYISPRYEGGIGGHAKRVAEKLRENGFDIELMNIPHVPIKNLKNPSFTILGTMKAMINSKKYDAVHAWNIPSSFVMKKINAKKKILSVHGIYGQQIEKIHSKTTSKIGKKAEEESFKIPDMFTTDSKYVQNFYKTQLGIDFVYLPAPLDVSKFDKIPDLPEKKNQVIYIGRDSYEKGIDILKNIEDKINGNVVYCTDLPWDETMKKLKESAILVIPSRMESIPQVIKEAFYLKKPVIATEVGGIPEIIGNNVTGILVPPENPQKLLEAINTILEDKSLTEKLVKNAFDFINQNFTWEKLLPKYIEFYKNT
ncbi:glycosyltransferase family 4 protein [Nitrosopumilus sp.]|uniref:glycosyltransferase family 4 protein n=1 Tax=Nitrosopumilus sp. TaxID=2024843 RepID=UPI003D0AF2BC